MTLCSGSIRWGRLSSSTLNTCTGNLFSISKWEKKTQSKFMHSDMKISSPFNLLTCFAHSVITMLSQLLVLTAHRANKLAAHKCQRITCRSLYLATLDSAQIKRCLNIAALKPRVSLGYETPNKVNRTWLRPPHKPFLLMYCSIPLHHLGLYDPSLQGPIVHGSHFL